MGQLSRQESRLHLIQAGVLAFINMMVLVVAAVIAQGADLLGQGLVAGGHAAGIAQGAQVFAGVKAEPGGIAQTACAAALVGGTVSLGSILDDLQAVGTGNLQNRVHVGALAVEVHSHDSLGLLGDGRLDAGGINVVAGQHRLHKDRRCPGVGDSQHGGNKGVGWHDNLVSWADAQRF